VPVFFAVVPKGNEELLCEELKSMGVPKSKATLGGVHFEAEWPVAYHILLWTRLASKLLHPLRTFSATTELELYEGVLAFPWEQHFSIQSSFAIDVVLKQAPLQHSQFVAQRVKDGIVDRFKKRSGQRPSVDRIAPDLRFYAVWQRNQVTLGVDLGGCSLHQRGYRKLAGEAPLKEHLAAAMLLRAGWPEIARKGGSLVDPFCGSGTLVIEAFLMAANVAPGLLNPNLGARAWFGFKPELWQELRSSAQKDGTRGMESCSNQMIGADLDGFVLKAAITNAQLAGISHKIQFITRGIESWLPEHTSALSKGLVIANPPYGERMGDLPEAIELFTHFGETLKSCFLGWEAAILTGDRILGKQLALRAYKVHPFKNGPLDCNVLRLRIEPDRFAGGALKNAQDQAPRTRNPGEEMFANRLRKNQKRLAKWLKKEQISCYRLYDADMPEYNVAVDIYENYVLVQEYQAPKSVAPEQAEKRLHDVLSVVPEVLKIPAERLILKTRQRQRGKAQYEKLDHRDSSLLVKENGLTFEVNLTDYLDTGLFLDHRPIRQRLEKMAKNKVFLNLFAYTGSATVYAARGGARQTLTVDLSPRYLEWAERNMRRNGFHSDSHQYHQDDCLEWLKYTRERFDLIFLDPPTFSNSKRMQATLDIQRDHPALIADTLQVLNPRGTLIFSTNARKFQINMAELTKMKLVAEDWSKPSIPADFQQNNHIHQCWFIRREGQ